MVLQPFVGPWPLQFRNHFYTDCRTSWKSDQPVAWPLLTQNNTNRIKAHTDIHALSGIRTHDPIVRAREDSSCLRPRGHSNRPQGVPHPIKSQFQGRSVSNEHSLIPSVSTGVTIKMCTSFLFLNVDPFRKNSESVAGGPGFEFRGIPGRSAVSISRTEVLCSLKVHNMGRRTLSRGLITHPTDAHKDKLYEPNQLRATRSAVY
jgi:hypothetical protein